MRISIIGSGNVATHLGKALYASGHEIVDVFSPSAGHAGLLATALNARAITRLWQLSPQVDLCLIAVKDDVIEDLAADLKLSHSMVVHTAGSIPMQVLAASAPAYGVLYPFQTFSKPRQLDITQVPFCLEASDGETLRRLEQLVADLGARSYVLDTDSRKALHLAAVFACNFTNHLYTLAESLLREKAIPFDLLRPLIGETAGKALEGNPFEAQTGPAVRNDQKVIAGHLRQLEGKPELRELYGLLSESIRKTHKK